MASKVLDVPVKVLSVHRNGAEVVSYSAQHHAPILINYLKVRRLAIKSVLSSKVNDNNIIVLEDLTLDTAKTKEMAPILKGLSVEKSFNRNCGC